MSKKGIVLGSVAVVALVLWAALSRDSFPLVILAAVALVTTLVAVGPSRSRPDPREPQDAAEHIARQSRHTGGT